MSDCPDTAGLGRHGPADGRGRCPWCGKKYTNAAPAPRMDEMAELTEAYGTFYDPDHGARSAEEIRRRRQMGMD